MTDKKGNVVASASSGSLGFKGAKKGTPFAAKVGETLALKAQTLGVKEVSVVVKGLVRVVNPASEDLFQRV